MTHQQAIKKYKDDNQPWYRIGMVWLMIGLPFVVVVASLATVVIAYQNSPHIIQSQAR